MSDPVSSNEETSGGSNWLPQLDISSLGPASTSTLSYITYGDPTPSWMLAPYVLTSGEVDAEPVEEDIFYDATEEAVEDVVEDIFFDALAFIL